MAAKKEKMVSVNAIEEIVKERYVPTEDFDWHGVNIVVRKTIDFDETVKLVHNVVNNCFSDDGSYLAEAKDFLSRCEIIEAYTNVRLPQNVNSKYHILYCSDLFESVISCVNQVQLANLSAAIDDKIKNKCDMNTQYVMSQIAEAVSAIDAVKDSFENIFAGVGSEEFAKMVGALADGKFDEEKVAKVVLDQMTKKDAEA